MKDKLNNIFIGLGFGLLLPILAFFASFLFLVDNYDLKEYFFNILGLKLISPLLSLCVVPNLLLFFIFIWTNLLLGARGVLMSTIVYGFVVVIFRFFI